MTTKKFIDAAIDTVSLAPYTPAGVKSLGLPGSVSPATLHRWRIRGIRNVKLVTFLRGGRRWVTRQALQQFLEDVTSAADNGFRRAALPMSDAALRAAERDLEADGA